MWSVPGSISESRAGNDSGMTTPYPWTIESPTCSTTGRLPSPDGARDSNTPGCKSGYKNAHASCFQSPFGWNVPPYVLGSLRTNLGGSLGMAARGAGSRVRDATSQRPRLSAADPTERRIDALPARAPLPRAPRTAPAPNRTPVSTLSHNPTCQRCVASKTASVTDALGTTRAARNPRRNSRVNTRRISPPTTCPAIGAPRSKASEISHAGHHGFGAPSGVAELGVAEPGTGAVALVAQRVHSKEPSRLR